MSVIFLSRHGHFVKVNKVVKRDIFRNISMSSRYVPFCFPPLFRFLDKPYFCFQNKLIMDPVDALAGN